MNFLKRMPIRYKGELHDVRLVNFSVDMDEIRDQIPENIRVRDFGGRAMISMVDVKLKRMRPALLPPALHFNYRHIAFRVLVDDSALNGGASKGIYFLRSFTDNRLVVAGGRALTDYNLQLACIEEKSNEVLIRQGAQRVRYCLDATGIPPQNQSATLTGIIGALDRAYAMRGGNVCITEIQREKWPIQPHGCAAFENTFFRTAKLEGVFRVPEVIYYEWLPPRILQK